MPLQHRYKNREGGDITVYLDFYPDKCPVCSNGIHPVFLGIYDTKPLDTHRNAVDTVFRCPVQNCMVIFVGQYIQKEVGSSFYSFEGSRRLVFLNSRQFPEEVSAISVSFVEIYRQALIAENNGLDEICGSGYRRALEFLVKDFLISLEPENSDHAESIRKSTLGTCINMIEDQRIKSTAKRAAWLGNDETHYFRKWEGHDLRDLKNLIEITVSGINTSLLAKKYEKELPD